MTTRLPLSSPEAYHLMKSAHPASYLCSLACALLVPMGHAEIAPGELVAPKMEILDGNLNFTIQRSVSGRNYQLQWSDSMANGTWTDIGVVRSGDGSNRTMVASGAPS